MLGPVFSIRASIAFVLASLGRYTLSRGRIDVCDLWVLSGLWTAIVAVES
jgi:hypothetical protein